MAIKQRTGAILLFLALLPLTSTLALAQGRSVASPSKAVVGVKVYEQAPDTFEALFAEWADLGINTVLDVAEQRPGEQKIILGIQVSKAYLDTPLTLAEFEQNLEAALLPPSAGVFLWSWEHLDKAPEKKAAFKARIKQLHERHTR